jgi:hypothetical protein
MKVVDLEIKIIVKNENNMKKLIPNTKILSTMKTGGSIKIDPSKKGTFTAQATKMGMGVQQAASKILSAKEGTYTPAMRKKANFAKNFAK